MQKQQFIDEDILSKEESILIEKNNIKEDENKNNSSEGFCSNFLLFFSLFNMKKYFDFTDDEVLERLKLAVLFQKKELVEKIRRKPDLYNPFWITICFALLISIFSNINAFLHYDGHDFNFNYTILLDSFSVIMGSFVITPLLFFLFLLILGFTIKKDQLYLYLSLFAYSNIYLLISVALCFYPNELVNFVSLCAGSALSILFLIFVFSEYLTTLVGYRQYLGYIIIIGSQSLNCIFYKYHFFSNINYHHK